MRSTTSFIAACAVAVGFLAGPPVAALRQDAKFTYQWKKGAAIKYRVVQQSTTTISGLPGGMGDLTIDQSTTQTLSSVVEDVAADGAATLRQTVEAIKAEINSPMMAMSYDSAAPNASTGATIFKDVFSQLIGQPYTLTMAPNGEVKKVAGLSELADKLFKNITPDPATAGMLDGLKANLNDDAMRNMFTQSFAQFPDKPIKVGDTWDLQATSSNPMLGTLITFVKSTLKSIDAEAGGRTARVAVILSVKRDASKPVPPNPMGMTLDVGEATGDGEQIFDASVGLLRSSTVHLRVPMTMSGTGPDGSALNMQTQVKATTTTELIK
jgi:Family of unknown function (DUF6263)